MIVMLSGQLWLGFAGLAILCLCWANRAIQLIDVALLVDWSDVACCGDSRQWRIF